jgi:hypothetical protein
MFMILPSINLLRIKINRRQTHIQILRQWQPYLATPILRAVEFSVRDPAFGQALLDVFAKVLVVRVVWAVVAVESFFEGVAGGAVRLLGGWEREGGFWRVVFTSL